MPDLTVDLTEAKAALKNMSQLAFQQGRLWRKCSEATMDKADADLAAAETAVLAAFVEAYTKEKRDA